MLSNEVYLYVWYWGALALAAFTALAIWAYLRTPFNEIAGRLRSAAVTRALKDSFPLGFLLPVLAGFLGVNLLSLSSCGGITYEMLLNDRDYMVRGGQAQLSQVLNWSIEAVFIWGAMTFLVLVAVRATTKTPAEPVAEAPKVIGVSPSS
jgi:hypothetical protein